MNMSSMIHIILSTSCVYFFILIALRVLGKSELAQLSMTDLIFVLLISNAVQNAMVGSDSSLMGGLGAAATLFVMNYIFKLLKFQFPGVKRLVEGAPVLLVHHGKIIQENCRKNFITKMDLMQAIREHGSKNLSDIDIMILEMDGNLSVVSNDFKHHSIRRIKKRKLE